MSMAFVRLNHYRDALRRYRKYSLGQLEDLFQDVEASVADGCFG